MATSDVVNQIVTAASSYLSYMMPIIGVMAGIMFVASFVYYLATRLGDRTFNK